VATPDESRTHETDARRHLSLPDAGIRLGPLTDALFEKAEGDERPAIAREWSRTARSPGDVIFLWAGETCHASASLGWGWLTVHCGETTECHPDPVTSTPPQHVERLLTPLAHESRVRIMQALYSGPLSAGDLGQAVGFRGGSLYHHLRELKYAGYISDRSGRYDLTNLGRQMLITATAIARQAIVDRGEEGLGVGTFSRPAESPPDDVQ
jgi:DNA-binding transcriptional ArsR family regulator